MKKRIEKPKRLFWIINTSGWLLLVLINITFQTSFFESNFESIFYSSFFGILGFTLSIFLRFAMLKLDIVNKKPAVYAPLMIGLIVSSSALNLLIGIVISLSLFPEMEMSLEWFSFSRAWFNMAVIVAIWVLFYFSYLLLQKQRQLMYQKFELALQLKDAELQNLRKQLSPHFLFNAINNIRTLVLVDPDKARLALMDISDLLRYALNYQKKERVTLAEEMDVVSSYLNLNKIHLQDNVIFEMDIEEGLRDLLLPPMSVQLLVENAIKHGRIMDGGRVKIQAVQQNNICTIEVINPGSIDLDEAKVGIGLENLRKRLHAQFGERSQFTIEEKKGNVHAQITIEL